MYRMFFPGRNFVSSLLCTLRPNNLKTFYKKLVFAAMVRNPKYVFKFQHINNSPQSVPSRGYSRQSWLQQVAFLFQFACAVSLSRTFLSKMTTDS